MPKFTKGHHSCPEAIHPSSFLLITTNLFIKLWSSSSNSIWDILLTREKCPNLQRAITHEIFFRIYLKVNQAVYSSLQVYSSSFKTLASISFEIFCWQDCIHIFSKGNISGKGHNPVEKKICVSYYFMRNPVRNFKTVACNVSKVMHQKAWRMDGRTNGRTH